MIVDFLSINFEEEK